MSITGNVHDLLRELPEGVKLVVAAKTRRPDEIMEAVSAGVRIIGENYVQEAERARQVIGDRVEWHFIGHLQKNKVKKAVRIFDLIETVDSLELAAEIDRRSREAGRVMPVLIEVNSADESRKYGVVPDDVESLITSLSVLQNIHVEGLMTMGPAGDNEAIRGCFASTRQLFERLLAKQIPNVEMKYLSMGMTDSYHIAIEEGANIVRIGSMIFGPRA